MRVPHETSQQHQLLTLAIDSATVSILDLTIYQDNTVIYLICIMIIYRYIL